MNNWKQKKLSEICQVNPETRNRNWHHNEIEYIDISSVGTGQLIESPKRLLVENAPSRAQRIVRDGDIIVSTVRPNRRSFLYLKETKPETIASTGFAVLRAKEKNDSRFLYYLVTNQEFTDYLVSKAEGSAYPAVNPSVFSNADVLVPDYLEQKELAKILSSLDDKIELNRQMNATLEVIAKALFKAWFVDFEPVRANMENRQSESASPEIAKLFPSEFENDIPKGWQNGTLGDIATIFKQSISPNKFSEELFNHFSIPAFDEAQRPKIEEGSLIQSNKFLIESNSVLVSKLNPRIFRVWTVFAPKENRCVASTEFMLYEPQNKDYWAFLNNLMRNDEIISKFQQQVTGTSSSHQRVRPESTLNLDVVIPDDETAKVFNEIVSPMYLKVEENIEQIQNLAEIRNSLLPRLISGKIPVSQSEIKGATE